MVLHSRAAQRWSALIDEQEASGETVRAFADTHGLNIRTLSWWRCRLGRSRRSSPTAQPPEKPTTLAFDVVRVAETSADREAATDGTVVLALENLDAHIVVDRHTDLVLLRQVLVALC